MKIPVFVSCPTSLSDAQKAQRSIIDKMLASVNLEPRALGTSDYPADLPLREVTVIARHCSGGVVLGFNQLTVNSGVRKPGTKKESVVAQPEYIPTAWNNLEAGILFSLGLPLLIFKENGVSGGVFDLGTADVFVHAMPTVRIKQDDLKEIFLKWRDKVGHVYYTGNKFYGGN